MKSRSRNLIASGLIASTAILGVGLVAGPAMAAPPAQSNVSSSVAGQAPTTNPTNRAVTRAVVLTANKTKVMKGQTVTFTGTTSTMYAGNMAYLQINGQGTPSGPHKFQAKIKADGTFVIKAKANSTGKMRVVGAIAGNNVLRSSPVVITVSPILY